MFNDQNLPRDPVSARMGTYPGHRSPATLTFEKNGVKVTANYVFNPNPPRGKANCSFEAVPDSPSGNLWVDKGVRITVKTDGRQTVMTLAEPRPASLSKRSNGLEILMTKGKDGQFTLTARYAKAREGPPR